jgi:pimeloyl-ACP methyl ester carboxylesterase
MAGDAEPEPMTNDATPIGESWEHGYIEANGVRFHYVTQGEGPLILLLHGFPEHWYSWRHQIGPLAEAGYQVVAPDMRGYNLSAKPRSGYDIKTLTKDVHELIRAFGAEKASIVSHDWGGVIGLQFPLDYPDACERLVVMNAPSIRSWYWGPRNIRGNSYALAMQIPGLAERRMSKDLDATAEQVFRGMAVNKAAFTDEDLAVFARALKQPGGLSSPMKYYRSIYWPDWFKTWGDRHKRITCPTLFVWGRKDPAVRPEFLEDSGKNIDDLKVIWVEESSHWVQQEQPGEVNAALLDFFTK